MMWRPTTFRIQTSSRVWMLRASPRSTSSPLTAHRCASSTTAYSSADFISSSSSSSSATGADHSSSSSFTSRATAGLPTRESYQAMSDEQLAQLLETRMKQVGQLRSIYEHFHYSVDKHLRKTVLDYHDKAMQLSQVHGQMQNSSLRVNREALVKMREEQEMFARDYRMALFLSVVITLVFWVWVRRHYIHQSEVELTALQPGTSVDTTAATAAAAEVNGGAPQHQAALARLSPSVTGAGHWGGYYFGSEKRSARYRETAWEQEKRLEAMRTAANANHTSANAAATPQQSGASTASG